MKKLGYVAGRMLGIPRQTDFIGLTRNDTDLQRNRERAAKRELDNRFSGPSSS